MVEMLLDDLIEVLHMPRDEVGQTPVLHMGPEHLHWIQVGRICRQTLQVQPTKPAQERADERPFVIAAAIPDDDHLAAKMPQQGPQERYDSRRIDIVLGVGAEVEPESASQRGDADCRDRRDLVTMPPEAGKHGSTAFRRPGPANQRVEEEAAFVDQDEVRFLGTRLFLIRGHSSATQRLIATLFRSTARVSGFCGA